MFRRLLATTGVAATLLSASFAAAPVALAAPGDPNQVALVVDYPDGSSRTFCVGYSSGMTGTQVLAPAVPSYGTGPYAGFVLKIGGQGTTPPTTSDYWSYWRGTNGGAYAYSSSGVGATKPAAGSVERWIWAPTSTGSFQDDSYASLCPAGFAPTPASATTPAPAPTRVAAPSGSGGSAGGGSTPTGGRSASAGTGGSTAPGTGSPAATTPTTTGTTTGTGAATTAPSGGVSGTAPGASAPAGSTSVAASNVAAVDETGGLGAGPTVGLLGAGAAVVVFGVLAVVARRRRAEQD